MGELDALPVREDVLQAMYWIRSEGLGERKLNHRKGLTSINRLTYEP